MLELGAENSGVEVIESAVETETVDVALIRAVITEFADRGVNFLIICDQGSTVSKSAEVFLNNKTGRSN